MEELARMLVRILKWAMAAAIIGGVTLLAVVVMNWDNSPLRGGHLVTGSPPELRQARCNCDTPAKDETPPRRASLRVRRHVEAPPEVEEIDQPAAIVATPVEHEEMFAPSPLPSASPVVVVVPMPVPEYSVTVHPKNRHRWPRRFFGAIGRGVGKVIGVR